jgi:hypothetical protein
LAALHQPGVFVGQVNALLAAAIRKVRDLPHSGYLLPIYTLFVDAVEGEKGAMRALRNSWQPFTVDAFKAVDRGRLNSNGLCRQADIAMQEILDWS